MLADILIIENNHRNFNINFYCETTSRESCILIKHENFYDGLFDCLTIDEIIEAHDNYQSDYNRILKKIKEKKNNETK